MNIYGVFPHNSMLPIRLGFTDKDLGEGGPLMYEDPTKYKLVLVESGVRKEEVAERLGWYAEQYGLPDFAIDCKTELVN